MNVKEFIIKETSEEAMWNEFANLLKKHDWMFSMASGPAYYKGQKEDEKLRKLQKKLREIDKQKVVDYYEKYVPKYILNYFEADWKQNILTDK